MCAIYATRFTPSAEHTTLKADDLNAVNALLAK
jgi:hypothetical protein